MIEKVDLKSFANTVTELNTYFNLGHLNDHTLNLIAAESRILDFHTHEESDEMFYVLEGRMQMDFEEYLIDVNAGDFIIVPRGMRHRPVINELVKCLLIEKSGTLTKDNTGGTYIE